MFTHYKAQEPFKSYSVVLYERKKGQEVMF